MQTPASIAKHPIHPMLIVFPVGLWIFSLICDFVYVASGGDTWFTVSFYAMIGGLIGALAAAIPGAIDLRFLLQNAEIRKTALTHMAINLGVVVLYIINIAIRSRELTSMTGPLWLSIVSVGLLGVSGWLGAEMVHAHGVGVDTTGQTAQLRPVVKSSSYTGPERRLSM